MRLSTAGLLLLAALALLAGCASHPAYYVAPPPPPPPVAYAPPVIQVARQNGYADGIRIGERDRVEGHSFRPTCSEHYANTPGYSPQLGGPFRQYQSEYREAYMRGYRRGYSQG